MQNSCFQSTLRSTCLVCCQLAFYSCIILLSLLLKNQRAGTKYPRSTDTLKTVPITVAEVPSAQPLNILRGRNLEDWPSKSSQRVWILALSLTRCVTLDNCLLVNWDIAITLQSDTRYKALNVSLVIAHILIDIYYDTIYQSTQSDLKWVASGLLCHMPSVFSMGIRCITFYDRNWKCQ